jgi:hypothetical protein
LIGGGGGRVEGQQGRLVGWKGGRTTRTVQARECRSGQHGIAAVACAGHTPATPGEGQHRGRVSTMQEGQHGDKSTWVVQF